LEAAMPTFHPTDPLVTDIDQDVLEAQRQANALLADFPHPDVRTPEGLAALRTLTANNEQGTVLTPANRTIETGTGSIRLRTFVPESPTRGVMLRIHGGGWAAGAPEDDDTVNDRYARTCGLVIVSPEYRLAPDVSAVEQIAECAAVAEWLAANATAEFGSDTLLIGGISAGHTSRPRPCSTYEPEVPARSADSSPPSWTRAPTTSAARPAPTSRTMTRSSSPAHGSSASSSSLSRAATSTSSAHRTCRPCSTT
jgi:hypothetical protein